MAANAWAIDGVSLVLLCIGGWFGRPRGFRSLCRITLLYLMVFFVAYYIWLDHQFDHFLSHPAMIHTEISAGFAFEGFWNLLYSMFLMQGVVPVALIFLLYFLIKWLASSFDIGSVYANSKSTKSGSRRR